MFNLSDFIKKYSASMSAMLGTTATLAVDDAETKLLISGTVPILKGKIDEFADSLVQKSMPAMEKVKACVVLKAAAIEIENRLEKGEEIRDDGFFDPDIFVRSDMDEMMEAVVYAAQRENQAKKVRFMGNLLANILFDKKVGADYANALVNFTENATYRQLCQIYIACCLAKLRPRLPRFNVAPLEEYDDQDAFMEMKKLENEGIIRFDPELDISKQDNRLWGERIIVRRKGWLLFDLLNLKSLPEDDITKASEQLGAFRS